MEAKTSRGAGLAHPLGLRKGRLRERVARLRSAGGRKNGKVDAIALRLDQSLEETDAVILHHRRLDGMKLDHVVIGPSGITVIDSSHYNDGRARVGRGGLRVGRRNRTELVRDVLDKAEAIRETLAGTRYETVHVEAALAWRDVEGLPVLHSFNAPRVIICGTRRIAKEAARPGPLTSRRVASLATLLEAELPAE